MSYNRLTNKNIGSKFAGRMPKVGQGLFNYVNKPEYLSTDGSLSDKLDTNSANRVLKSWQEGIFKVTIGRNDQAGRELLGRTLDYEFQWDDHHGNYVYTTGPYVGKGVTLYPGDKIHEPVFKDKLDKKEQTKMKEFFRNIRGYQK